LAKKKASLIKDGVAKKKIENRLYKPFSVSYTLFTDLIFEIEILMKMTKK
jgi:hypothetical protein